MTDAPFRRQFDAARDPYAARNALGITGTGGSGGGAPVDAEYIVAADDPTLTNDRVLTNTATVTWDLATPGQVKANAATGGNVSNSGTPTVGQYGKWVTATTIQGVAPATVLSDIGAAPLASPTFTGDPKAPTPTAGDNDTSVATTAFVTAAIAVIPGATTDQTPPQGRLTLQTLTPVMTTTQAAKTTIYYTPYVGNRVPIYDGSAFVMTTFAELSVATTDTTKSPAAIGASKVNDWFVWSDAGTIRIGHGPDWTSDTARSAGTALVMVNGVLLNNASITNGPAAQRGTYVGTTRSNGSSQLDWIFGGAAAGGTAGLLAVWNCYNRVNVTSLTQDTTASFSVGSNPLNWMNSANNRCSFICGLAEDAFDAVATGVMLNGASGTCVLGVALDTSGGSAVYRGQQGFSGATVSTTLSANDTMVTLGYHFYQMVHGAFTANATAFGTISAGIVGNGLTVRGRM